MPRDPNSLENIVDAAFRLFMEQGYHGTSMRQIAEEAGLAPGSLYNHFGGKEDIFSAVIRRHHPYHEMVPALRAAQGESVEDIVHDASRRMINIVQSRPELINLLFIELVEFKAAHAQSLFVEIFPQFLIFDEKLKRASGELRPTDEVTRLLSFAGVILSQWVIRLLIGGSRVAPDTGDIFRDAVDIYLHGILAPTEREEA